MKNTKLLVLTVLAAAATPLYAQDSGAMVADEIGTIAGYAATIIPAGLIIWGSIWGVRKLKSMGSASS